MCMCTGRLWANSQVELMRERVAEAPTGLIKQRRPPPRLLFRILVNNGTLAPI